MESKKKLTLTDLHQPVIDHADASQEPETWPLYSSQWPGCTWLWLYLNPAPLGHVLEMMILVPIEQGERQQKSRIGAWLN
ncbi:MAG TPA: hypothetical protein PKD09_09410 [Aggregatilinea sp.]|uniref:hypothetical protein n=1 Tax=Aggregatilinea sp. TaxID=2806333 RepID=UPI002B9B408C|nr:hypothetical protein [Aggregatilinea sp.]HML21854.1 hypothetical protein [Aggregatilinea sp.]